jgi:hypothetical protein
MYALFLVILCAGSAMFACSCTQVPQSGSFALPDAGNDPPPPEMRPDASSDAGSRPDAPAADDASLSSYPLSKCSISQDVFYIDVTGSQGRLALGESTHTDMGTNWFVELQPELNVMLETSTGPVGNIQVWTADSSPAVPGTYPQGSSSQGTTIDLVVIKEGCSVTSGTFTLVDLQYDWPDGSTQGDVTSLLLSFDLTCSGQRLRGCVKYSR